ncbi:cytochrome c5 family protein [Halomonas eurihalina]|uniref:Cytochrome c5 family protein n=1 Tax=Halomonas eurihalina TaxID=42566 RepID=A0A5D9DCA4_HALER|nr:c-type cytochrome [Halomonas eurihalina]MDR5860181.1 c-type cytochrome [Halomonas eurihalina]TZG40391.1 cytochrome c5 family protein [Halomonas eurihalina]
MKSSKLIVGCLATLGLTGLTFAQEDASHDAIAKRLAPVGDLCLQGQDCGTSTSSAGGGDTSAGSGDGNIDGQAIYESICTSCHATGVANAPKMGDTEAWSQRLEKGTDTLYTHVIDGFNAMPPKGGDPSLSDAEVKAAVDYLLEESQ